MSGFRMEIQISEARWQALTPEEQKRLQDIVDGVYEPAPDEIRDLIQGKDFDADKVDIIRAEDGRELHIPKE